MSFETRASIQSHDFLLSVLPGANVNGSLGDSRGKRVIELRREWAVLVHLRIFCTHQTTDSVTPKAKKQKDEEETQQSQPNDNNTTRLVPSYSSFK